jgi:hypothetical protein
LKQEYGIVSMYAFQLIPAAFSWSARFVAFVLQEASVTWQSELKKVSPPVSVM